MNSYITTSEGHKVTTSETLEGRRLILRKLDRAEIGSPSWHLGTAIQMADATLHKNPTNTQFKLFVGHLWRSAEGLIINESELLEPVGNEYKILEQDVTIED